MHRTYLSGARLSLKVTSALRSAAYASINFCSHPTLILLSKISAAGTAGLMSPLLEGVMTFYI